VLLLGGRHFGAFGAAAQDESLETYLEAGRDCARRHAWDSPPHENLKEVTDRALARFPGEARVLELRRDSAERLVTDALGRKYAGDPPEALHLAKLALELEPSLTTAQHLVAELEGAKAPEVAPAASEGKDPERSPKATARKTTPRVGPGVAGSAAPTASANASPVLPQTPPPLPADSPPAPAPTSTGPWL
jgi:serine/threonine-protein kinase